MSSSTVLPFSGARNDHRVKANLARDPHARSLKIWHQVLLVGLIYDLAVIPFDVTFDPNLSVFENPIAIVFYAWELLFLLDFHVKLTTGFYKGGNVIYNLQQCRMRYLTSAEFVADVLTIVPYAALPVNLSVPKMVLEIPKVLRAYRIPKYLVNVDDVYVRHFELLKLSKLFVGVLLLSHYIACIRFSFGYDEHQNNHWLPVKHAHGPTIRTQYLQSMFWAFGLLTGLFEGELPHAIDEFVFTIAVAMCGFSVFTYLCATFFLLSKCEPTNSEVAEARVAQLKHILEFHHVPDHVTNPTIEYLRHYNAGSDTSDREVTKLLCSSICKDVQVELLKDLVAKVPVFTGCSAELIDVLTSLLERISLPSQCTLFTIGDFGDAMYIVHAGVLDIIGRNGKIRELRKNDVVGEFSLFSNLPRSATVVTNTYCVLYKLSRFHTELVLDSYPKAAGRINNLVTMIMKKAQMQPKGIKCQSTISERRKSDSESEAQGISQPRTLMNLLPGVKQDGTIFDGKQDTKTSNILRLLPHLPPNVLSVESGRISGITNNGYDEFSALDHMRTPKVWWAIVLLKKCLDCTGTNRAVWILLLQLILIFNWCLIPLQLAFLVFDNMNFILYVLNGVTDVILWADIYVNFNLAYMQAAEKVQVPAKSAVRYLRGAFVLDLICVLPYEVFVSRTQYCLARIPRLLRFWRAPGHVREVDAMYPLRSKHRLMLFAVLLFLLIHIETCMYFSVTFVKGFSTEEDAWLPKHDIELHRVNDTHFIAYDNSSYTLGDPALERIATMQYFRSFYFATHILTGLGKGVEPESDLEYIIALMFMFSGFVITAIVVDNVQKRFTASAHEEKEFFAVRSRIQGYLRRQNAPVAIFHRVNVFLDFWWASHRGALVSDLLVDLPTSLKKEVMRSIYAPALQTMALLAGVRLVLSDFEDALIENAELMLYGQGEHIYQRGDSMHGLYVLLQGQVLLTKADMQFKILRGEYFGTQILRTDTEHSGSTDNATTESGCVVLFLSRHTLQKLHSVFPSFGSELIILKARLLKNKLAKSESNIEVLQIFKSSGYSRWLCLSPHQAIDPDSKYVIAWEIWLSVAMTAQWVRVLMNICFGVATDHFVVNDAVTFGLEVSFLVDIYVRSCLGYREFGNKIMDLKLIRRRYLRSWYFIVDVIALIPLYMLNWLPGFGRWELLNVNKVLRLVKVPNQFRALEQRYIKFATELRLMKLVYYTFVSTHVLGCIYFDFASHASGIHGLVLEESSETSFGENAWSLPKSLEHEQTFHQYFAANFWAFGIMSDSNTGELPESTPQCVLSIITLVTGFFLFAYVIGNFSDIIELTNAENREFNAKLGPIRHLLAHFTLPAGLETKIKMMLFFKRFHSITQEEVLERYLPPPLMTDIRLLNLRPLMEKVPFFENMDASITRILVAQFKQVLMLKHDFVYEFGDKGTDMYFVLTGVLTMFAPLRRNSSGNTISPAESGQRVSLQKVSDMHAGDFFGENALFADVPRTAFVRTKTSCILYSLSSNSLNLVFELYPDWMNRVLQSVKIQQKQQKQQSADTSNQVRRSFFGPSALELAEPFQPLTNHHLQSALTSRANCRVWFKWLNALSSIYEAQSRMHLTWLRIVITCTFYIAVMVPSCVAFDACRTWDGMSLGVNFLEVCCFVVFVMDIWVNLHLKQTDLTTELYEVNIRDAYRRERLLIDIVAALPVEYVFYVASLPVNTAWLGLNRCVKVLSAVHYMDEIHRQSVAYEWSRLQTISLLYVLIIYWGSCAYLLFADHEGYSTEWNSWFLSTKLKLVDNPPLSALSLRLFRGLFFSVTAFIKKGRTFTPEGQAFVFALVVCFIGLMVMAFMIGEIASLFISSIDNEVNYRKNHIAVEHTMARWKVSTALNARVQMFLSNLWSSHRGVIYQDVFDTLPPQIREEMVLHIVDVPLQALIFNVFRPITQGDGLCLDRLTHAMAVNLRFESYPSGERVVVEGRIPENLFFVVSGKLVVLTKARGPENPIAHYTQGDYFSERGILTHAVSEISVQTQMPCEMFALKASVLASILLGDEFFSIVLRTTESVFRFLRSVSKENADLFPMTPQAWEHNLRMVLENHRHEWVVQGITESAPFSKGEALWRKVLTTVLDTSQAPLSCVQLFRPFIDMMGPKGELFAQRRVSGSHENGRKPQQTQLRSLLDHIGAVAANTANRVAPILKRSSISRRASMSRRTSVSHRNSMSGQSAT